MAMGDDVGGRIWVGVAHLVSVSPPKGGDDMTPVWGGVVILV